MLVVVPSSELCRCTIPLVMNAMLFCGISDGAVQRGDWSINDIEMVCRDNNLTCEPPSGGRVSLENFVT